MIPQLFFLCGPHASGKTSVLEELKKRGFIQVMGLELGKELFYKQDLSSDELEYDFEDTVTRLELQRDNVFVQSVGIIGVESWHPGNLAYAIVRNPSYVHTLVSQMTTSPFMQSAHGIWISTSKESVFQRTTTFAHKREWASQFYEKINQAIPVAMDLLGFNKRYTKVDGNQNFEKVLEDVQQVVSGIKF